MEFHSLNRTWAELREGLVVFLFGEQISRISSMLVGAFIYRHIYEYWSGML